MRRKRHYRVIESTMMSRLQALRILEKHGLYAEYYQAPQGEDFELAEAMKLLEGLGFVIRDKKSDLMIGKFIEAEPFHGGNANNKGQDIDSVIPIHFQHIGSRKFSFKEAISKISKL